MFFLIPILISVGASVALGYLLRPKVDHSKTPELAFPEAQEGEVLDEICGIGITPGALVWWGDSKIKTGNDGFTSYKARAMFAICHGIVDELLDIQFGGKSIRDEYVRRGQSYSNDLDYILSADPDTDPNAWKRSAHPDKLRFYMSALAMFGGEKQQGGVAGLFELYWGTNDQAVSELAKHALGDENASAYPGVCYANLGTAPTDSAGIPSGQATDGIFHWSNNNPNPNPPAFLVKRIPNYLGLGGVGEHDANPAEMIVDKIRSKLRGAGIDNFEEIADVQSFVTCGNTLAAEGYGLSYTQSSASPAGDVIAEICKHVDAVVFEHPHTQRLTMRLARSDYFIGSLFTVTKDNCTDFELDDQTYRETANEIKIKFKRYVNGSSGQNVTGEVLASPLGEFPGWSFKVLKTKYNQITNVTVYSDGVDITAYCGVRADVGQIIIWGGAQDDGVVSPTSTITIDYKAGTVFNGFRDAVNIAQNIANRRITTELRSQPLDFPYCTTDWVASLIAGRMLKAFSFPLRKITFKLNREAAEVLPADAIKVNLPDENIEGVVFRVLDVDYGEYENGWIGVTALEDIYAFPIAPTLSVGGGGGNKTGEAPPMAAIYCIGENQLALQASDATYDIEIQAADDINGTNAVTLEIVPGTTTTYTDATPGRTHRARMVRDDSEPGPWTPWLTACLITDEPGCIIPTWSAIPDLVTGDLVLSITDPQSRLIGVSFRTKSGSGPWSDWTDPVAMAPFEASVTLSDTADSFIEYTIEYYDCDGASVTIDETVTYPFDTLAPPPPPPDSGGDGNGPVTVDVPFHTTGNGTEEFTIPVDAAEVPDQMRVVFDTTGFTQMRLEYQFDADDPAGPAGSFAYVECRDKESTDDADFIEPATVAGPAVALDPTAGPPRWSDWVDLKPEAIGDKEFRRLTIGGDGSTEIRFRHFRMQFRRTPLGDPNDPEAPQEPEPLDGLLLRLLGTTGKVVDTTGGGAGVLDSLEIEGLPTGGLAALIAYMSGLGWELVTNSVGPSSQTVEVDASTVEVGAQSLHFNVTHDAYQAGEIYFQKTYTGLTPGDPYLITARVRTHNRPWFSTPTLSVTSGGAGGAGYDPSGSLPDDNWTGLKGTGSANASGEVIAQIGMSFMLGVGVIWDTWFDGTVEITGNTPGGGLIEWDDQSGNGNNAVWVSGPQGSDGGDRVLLTGGAKLQLPAGMFGSYKAIEIYAAVIAAADPNSGNNRIWHFGLQDSNYPNGSGHIIEGAGRATAGDAGDPPDTLTAARLYHVRVSEAGVQVLVGGAVIATLPPGAITWDSVLSIGGGVTFLEIDVYGLALPHTDQEVAREYRAIIDRNPDTAVPPGLPENPGDPGDPLPPIAGAPVLALSVDVHDILTVPPFNGVYGSTFLDPASDVITNLDYATTNNIGIFCNLLTNRQLWPSGEGSFSTAKGLSYIDQLASSKTQAKAAYDAGILRGVIVGDDINQVKRWGSPIPSTSLEAFAQRIKQVWGFDIPCYVRADPLVLEDRRFNWTYVNGSIAQYTGVLLRQRWDIGTYIANMLASANRQRLRLVVGTNMTNAGNGSSGIRNSAGGYWQSATDIRRDNGAIAQAIVAGKLEKITTSWLEGWRPDSVAYVRRSDIRAAFEYVWGILNP